METGFLLLEPIRLMAVRTKRRQEQCERIYETAKTIESCRQRVRTRESEMRGAPLASAFPLSEESTQWRAMSKKKSRRRGKTCRIPSVNEICEDDEPFRV